MKKNLRKNVSIYIPFYITILLLCIGINTQAQSIRKPWEEFTAQERLDYVNAINSLSRQFVVDMVEGHADDGNHHSAGFLPWHRIFIQHFEDELKSVNEDVSIPYWDWHESWDRNSSLFMNGNNGFNGLLGYDINNSIWSFTRSFSSNLSQPNDSYKNTSSFQTFESILRTVPHNRGHVFIGGTMGAVPTAPGDPMFYIHHAMVDKAWADWYNENPNADVSLLSNTIGTFDAYPVNTVNTGNLIDPRDSKLWYAYDNLLTLDNYISTGVEKYRYTTGNIESGNFTVSNNTSVNFIISEGNSIFFKPGFNVKRGAVCSAKVEENEFSSKEEWVTSVNSETVFKSSLSNINSNSDFSTSFSVYPNPFDNQLTIEANEEISSVQIMSLDGKVLYTGVKGLGQINTSNLSRGFYVMTIELQSGNTITKKIIKK